MGTSRWKAATNRRGTLRMVECRRLIRFLSNCFLLGLVGLMCGCVTENIQGQTRTFSFETWMPLSATIVSLTVLGVACCWRRARKLWGGSLLVIPVLIIITFVPELWLSRITVDPALVLPTLQSSSVQSSPRQSTFLPPPEQTARNTGVVTSNTYATPSGSAIRNDDQEGMATVATNRLMTIAELTQPNK